ncbi:MAG: hypothetical protein N3B21_09265 [Clostridia bacterium]|nr:hypothetical protein [Clostridia bacterium]
MDYMNYYQMINPCMACSPVMNYPVENLQDMYPDVYKRVYPRIKQVCIVTDVESNPEMNPYPSRAAVERMADEIYNSISMEMGDLDDDNRQFGVGVAGGYPGYYGYPGYAGYYNYPAYGYYGGRRFLRDLIGILLIRELLGRRGIYYY